MKAMKRVLLEEFKASTPVYLSTEELRILRRLAPQLRVAPSDTRDRYELTPDSHVGIIKIGDTILEIRPKMAINRFFFLLSYAVDPASWRSEEVPSDAQDSILEAVAPAFCRLTARATFRGLLHGYRAVEDALPIVRGQIRFRDQMQRRHGMLLPVEVRYDDFTPDIDENRILLGALHCLSVLPIRSVKVRQGLREVASAFQGVSIARMTATTIPAINFTRLNQHYEHALNLATLILKSASLEFGDARCSGTSFLVDMNVIFEKFVRRALREELGLTEAEFPEGKQHGIALDVAGRIRLYPDLTWWRRGRCLFVGDAKYKTDKTDQGYNPDLYQMLAYLVASNLSTGTLIYARGESGPTQHRIRHIGKTVIVEFLKLDVKPDQVLGQIGGLAQGIRHGVGLSGAVPIWK